MRQRGYRNGHGKTRRLSMMGGTIEVKRPRVRGLEQRFESRLLPLFVHRTAAVIELLPRFTYLQDSPEESSNWRCAVCSATARVNEFFGFTKLLAFSAVVLIRPNYT